MARFAVVACMLMGCGLILELDPEDPDAGPRRDVPRRDISESDARQPDGVPPMDGRNDTQSEPVDGSSPGDAVVVDANGYDADGNVMMECRDDGDCETETPCHRAVCETGRCSEEPDSDQDGRACDDGLYCTDDETCNAGRCIGPPRQCPPGDQCTQPECDEGNRECTYPPVDDGGECAVVNGIGTCIRGLCSIADCDPGFDDCLPAEPGCETNTNTNLAHCGDCTPVGAMKLCIGECIMGMCNP